MGPRGSPQLLFQNSVYANSCVANPRQSICVNAPGGISCLDRRGRRRSPIGNAAPYSQAPPRGSHAAPGQRNASGDGLKRQRLEEQRSENPENGGSNRPNWSASTGQENIPANSSQTRLSLQRKIRRQPASQIRPPASSSIHRWSPVEIGRFLQSAYRFPSRRAVTAVPRAIGQSAPRAAHCQDASSNCTSTRESVAHAIRFDGQRAGLRRTCREFHREPAWARRRQG